MSQLQTLVYHVESLVFFNFPHRALLLVFELTFAVWLITRGVAAPAQRQPA